MRKAQSGQARLALNKRPDWQIWRFNASATLA